MKALPIILAAGAVVVLVRVVLRRRAHRRSSRRLASARSRSASGAGRSSVTPALWQGARSASGCGAGFSSCDTYSLRCGGCRRRHPHHPHRYDPKRRESGSYRDSPSLGAELQGLAKSVGLSVHLVDEPDLARRAQPSTPVSSTWWWTARGRSWCSDPISDTDTSAGASYVRAVSPLSVLSTHSPKRD